MTNFKGKSIYNPSGKAGEYSYWACNFFVGCSNGCTYCYLKKGRGAAILGGDKPELKKCFRNEAHALEVFEKELLINIEDLRKHGLFFTFTSDPMLDECFDLTWKSIMLAMENDVPVKMLTKVVGKWVDQIIDYMHDSWKPLLAIGFTLTGHDELEPNASTNSERIEAMRELHEAGFKIFASIEPVIDFKSSYEMILESYSYCNLFKIGLLSGQKYPIQQLSYFVTNIENLLKNTGCKVYYKDSVLSQLKLSREYLKNEIYVNRDYNLFK